jgi:hypothetical protein
LAENVRALQCAVQQENVTPRSQLVTNAQRSFGCSPR